MEERLIGLGEEKEDKSRNSRRSQAGGTKRGESEGAEEKRRGSQKPDHGEGRRSSEKEGGGWAILSICVWKPRRPSGDPGAGGKGG